MEAPEVIDILREGVWVLLLISAPMMLTALFIGLIVSLVQALTQIQEMTLTFVPKLVAMLVVMVLSLPYMIQTLVDYNQDLYARIADME